MVLVQKEITNAYIGIPNPESIVLDKSSISLTTIGQTEQLTATLTPTPCDQSITWSTSDGTIATVSTSGLVTCVTPGTATITATTVNGLTASCSVRQTRLPVAYQEVEWIESSGTQYINTSYTPKTTTEFDITYEWVSFVNQYQTPIGARRYYNSQAYYFGWDSVNNRSFYGFGTNHVDPASVAFGGLGPKFNITYKNGVISNGNQTANVTVSNTPSGNLCIFAEEDNGNVQEYCNMKLYGLKLYESGTLIRDFVPCYRIADSVIGLYDVVNDVFYINNGTGTFTKGSDV